MRDPEPNLSSQLDAEGIPDMEGSPPGMSEEDRLEGITPPRDFPQGVDEFGIVNAEQRLDEPLAERVWREEPEVRPGDPDTAGIHTGVVEEDAVNRLASPQAELGELDVTKDEVAHELHDEPTALSAEESAMHVSDAPPMGDGDGYVDDGGGGPA